MNAVDDPETANSQDKKIPQNKNCFVVMPFGSDPGEQRWFKGWYHTVIEQAVVACGYNAILSANEHHATAINDEIRAHLVFDPMVVVDLGGTEPDDPPNPNVMYELGIRHAFGLPLVILAWEGQKLPFDVNNQRAIMTKRDFLDIEPTRQKLMSFIKSAEDGKFYKPMDAVGRVAAIEQTTQILGEDSLLGALANEIKDLKESLQNRPSFSWRKLKTAMKVKGNMNKELRAALWKRMQLKGVDPASWGSFLATPITEETKELFPSWSIDEWERYALMCVGDLANSPVKSNLPEEIIQKVLTSLPPQPWPPKVHEFVAELIGEKPSRVSRAIKELIDRGAVHDQIDGVVISEVEREV
jgi:hypothetical protein